MSDVPANPPRKLLWLSLFGTLLVLGSVFAYFLWMDIPFVRSTAAPTFAIAALGVILGLVAATKDARLRTRIAAGVNVALVALYVFAFFFAGKLPETSAATALARAPNFELLDDRGQPFPLQANLAYGPLMLIFYRGHW